MTGYSRTWDCEICAERQESIDYPPKPMLCDKCLEPLAAMLCREEMNPVKRSDNVDIWHHKAVNQRHFYDKAQIYARALLKRRGSKHRALSS